MTAAAEEEDIFCLVSITLRVGCCGERELLRNPHLYRRGGAGEELRHCPTRERERERESDDDDALKSTVDVESIRFPPVVKEFEYFPCVARWLTTQISLSLSLSPGGPPHSRKVA